MIEKYFVRTVTFDDALRSKYSLGQGRRVDDASQNDITGTRHLGRRGSGDYTIRDSFIHFIGVWVEAGDLVAVLNQASGHL